MPRMPGGVVPEQGAGDAGGGRERGGDGERGVGMKKDASVIFGMTAAAIIIAVAVITGPIFGWYKAGVQAEVYRRQGVEMTQWEVFVGAHPAERTVNIKEGKEGHKP